ncbi:discoidin domain-containing protein [Jiangella asiatica]|nr:discoidin domain-containing protein [Jiangella asiatica]
MRVSRPLILATSVTLAGLVAAVVPSSTGSSGDVDVPTDGGDPNGYVIGQHDHSTVFEPVPGVIAGNALVEAFDDVDADGLPTRRVQMTWQSNEDVAAADSEASMIHSDDGGFTFPSGVNTDTGAGWFSKLRDGSIIGVEFIPRRVIDDHTVELIARRSTDNGRTWKDLPSTFTTDLSFDESKFDRGIRVHRDIFYAADGSLLMTYYTTYAGDPGYRTELARSTDGGRTWHRYATVATFTDGVWMGESGIARAANGELVAVHRTGTPGGANVGLIYTNRSSDDGRTWSRPQPLQITTASGEPAPTTGVMPVLRLLPNGIMTLTFGRPDNWIAISPDGLGHSFEQAQTTYVNHPRVNASFQRFHGSSGNGAHAVVGANRVLVVGDNCAPSWGCPETDAGFTIDGEYRVWKKFVDVVAPNVGKIDLLGKYEAGTVTIDTDMNHADARLPETGPLGAIDGSADWASAAVQGRPRGDGTYTVTLDRTYTLNQIGLHLQYGAPSAARVEVSTDGETWTEVLDTGTVTTYALRYFELPDVEASQVRVTVADTDPQALEFLGELELYSTVDSFENDPVGQVPRGYTSAIGATVTDFDVDDSRHVMRLTDAWIDKIASARWSSDPADEQSLAFRVNSIGYARSFAFTVLGSTADAEDVPAYHLNVGSDGSIGWYSYETQIWTKLAPAGTAPQRVWHELRVDATLDGAEVFLGGESIGTVEPSTLGITALTGHRFASSGTSSHYDHFLIDDVEQS